MSLRTKLIVSILSALALSALLAALFPVGSFWIGFLSGALLLALCIFALLSAWTWAGGGKTLLWLVALAFVLRLGVGAAASLILPVSGYPEKEQKAGYLFYDAYKRDTDAWEIVRTDRPLFLAFTADLNNDQYGGLMTLSALIYKGLSPDAHRAYLILILAAFAFAVGVPFFFRAVGQRWGPVIAALATWILVLYPDGILFSASQMREPFLIGLTCIALWAVSAWSESPRRSLWVILAALVGMALFSTRIVFLAAGVLAVLFFLDHLYERIPGRWKYAAWAAFGLAGLAALVGMGSWMLSSAKWDMLLAGKYSGFSLKAIQAVGDAFSPVFYTIYGMARPLLPAALGSTAAARTPLFWKAVDVFRSTGWYALLPFVGYSFLVVWKAKGRDKRALLWLAAAVLAWLVIASARAGGDQWDNPRYRIIFLPWMALLAAWGIHYARVVRCVWLPRLLAVEVIFLAVFSQWYLSRYWTWLGWNRWTFWRYPITVLVLSALVLGGGLAWDLWKARGKRSPAVRE